MAGVAGGGQRDPLFKRILESQLHSFYKNF